MGWSRKYENTVAWLYEIIKTSDEFRTNSFSGGCIRCVFLADITFLVQLKIFQGVLVRVHLQYGLQWVIRSK